MKVQKKSTVHTVQHMEHMEQYIEPYKHKNTNMEINALTLTLYSDLYRSLIMVPVLVYIPA